MAVKDSKIHVLHVLSGIDSRQGGPAVALVGLATAQAELGMRVSVLVTYSEGDDLSRADELRARQIDVTLVGPASGALMRHRRLYAAAKECTGAADVLHIHALWEEIQHAAALTAKRMGKPYFMRPCGMLDPWSLSQSKWKKRAYLAWRLRSDLNGATGVHFTAELERESASNLRLRAPALVEPNGLSLDEFSELPPPDTFRSRFSIPAERPLLLFLGRIHQKKGLDYLLPAFAAMEDRRSLLAIAGPDDSGYAREMQELANQLGVADRVFFAGMLRGADRVAALSDADLFVLPSRQENFGIAVVEALAAGTPVLISDQVNIYREIVAAGGGAAVPLGVEPLTVELNRWMADSALREAAGARGRAFAFRNYDWRAIAARWQDHYAAATTGSGGSAYSTPGKSMV